MKSRIPFLISAFLLLSLSASAQQKKKPAPPQQQAAPKQAAPRPAAPKQQAPDRKTVKILPDKDCIILVDGEEKARCSAGQIAKIYLPSTGLFYIEVVSTDNRNSRYTRSYEVKDFRDDLLQVSLPESSKSTIAKQPSSSEGSKYISDAITGKFILVRGGTFTMGCTNEQSGCYDDESPTHRVTLSDFYLGETEVTQAQWREIMGSNPSNFSGCDQCPVEQVSWNDIQDFLSRLNSRSGGVRYRLPTEAEWEYAARGGNQSRGYQYSGSNNLDEVAWYTSNSGSKTRPVKGKKANELGLYDMSGNVWEWCSDWYGSYSSGSQTNPYGPSSGSARVVRGGSWGRGPARCRVANRLYNSPDDRYYALGFRLARTP